jgi:hypothetical protein
MLLPRKAFVADGLNPPDNRSFYPNKNEVNIQGYFDQIFRVRSVASCESVKFEAWQRMLSPLRHFQAVGYWLVYPDEFLKEYSPTEARIRRYVGIIPLFIKCQVSRFCREFRPSKSHWVPHSIDNFCSMQALQVNRSPPHGQCVPFNQGQAEALAKPCAYP